MRIVDRSTELRLPTVPVPVMVALVGRAVLEAELFLPDRPNGEIVDHVAAPRVIDHLNHPGQCVRLWTPEQHYLINKAQIVGVTES